MIDSRHSGDGIVARQPLAAVLWLLIAVALLSALAPLGLPLSRMTGSAFNPATSDVVTQVRAAIPAQAVQVVRPDGDGPFLSPLLAWALLMVMGWRLRPVAMGHPVPASLHRTVRPALALARAPPALS